MAAALRTALSRLGFSAPCCAFFVDVQGMDSLEEFTFLLDSDVENLCRVCRKPGGTLVAPTATDANRTIPHAGSMSHGRPRPTSNLLATSYVSWPTPRRMWNLLTLRWIMSDPSGNTRHRKNNIRTSNPPKSQTRIGPGTSNPWKNTYAAVLELLEFHSPMLYGHHLTPWMHPLVDGRRIKMSSSPEPPLSYLIRTPSYTTKTTSLTAS
jgi:hypothetical protein